MVDRAVQCIEDDIRAESLAQLATLDPATNDLAGDYSPGFAHTRAETTNC